MNLGKAAFGFFVLLAAALNFGFFVGDRGRLRLLAPHGHEYLGR